MPDSLPTLKGLRAFEEAFLLRSYTAAARKLNVQQPAISYQIKRLEEDLGVQLFDKDRGQLTPTQAANELFDTVQRSFDSIRKVSEKLRKPHQSNSFTIATYPGIGTYWLSSRLALLSKALAMPVKIVTLVKDEQILDEDADCRILFGKGNWPDHTAKLLMPETVCPVGAPDLARTLHQGISKGDFTIIEQEDPENRWICWQDWMHQTGETAFSNANQMTVNDHGLALHLALTGAGITLAWTDMVRDLLNSGSLVPLSENLATSDAGYWLVAQSDFFDTDAGIAVSDVLSLKEAPNPATN